MTTLHSNVSSFKCLCLYSSDTYSVTLLSPSGAERITVTTTTTLEMSSPKRASWTVVVGVGVVEALKDQGLCRWNSGFKSAQQSVKSHFRSLSQAKKLSSSSSAVVSSKMHGEKVKRSEESLRSVMYLSCWGPS
ncbi:hypothetical protein VNO80_27412 [Phaseolus coccineus]|uniref:Wound-responsive family protein n=1 Tax=Phaseolus coccineus TaxID=3886 RepID=A0AAN9LGJ7_PHACN